MALRLRRGSDTDRQTETFVEGELIYVTDTKQLYVGDGTTLGGVLVTSSSADSPATLTQNLDLNGFDISGSGNITATSFTGDGSGLTGITSGGGIDLGQTYLIDIIGDVIGVDSTLLVDSTTNSFNGDLTGDVTGNLAGNVTGNISSSGASSFSGTLNLAAATVNNATFNLTGNVTGNTAGTHTGNVIGNVTGSVTGDVTGDVVGSVFADSSTALVDAVAGKLVGDIDNVLTQTEQFKLYAGNNEAAVLETKKTNTGLTFDTGTVISYDRSVYTDATGDGTAYTNIRYTDRAVTYVGGLTGTNAISHSTVGVHIGSEVDSSEKLEVSGNVKINASSLIFNDSRLYTDIVVPTDGELMFESTNNTVYFYSEGLASWSRILAVDVTGGILETNAAVLIGGFDTAARDSIGEDSSTIDGGIIYNIDDDRMQFFQAGSWVNLPNNGQAIGEVLKWNGTEWTAAPDTGGVIPGSNADFLDGFDGTYYLDYDNFTNTPTIFDGVFSSLSSIPTTLAGYGITDAATSTQGGLADSAVQPADLGSFTFVGSTLDTSDSSGITITPAVTVNSDLTVENNLTVTNTVYAERFESTATGTPSIEAATNLDLTAGNAVRITSSVLRLASFTTTERDALAAQNGDIIYNTTDNKFQGYENGAWANLI